MPTERIYDAAGGIVSTVTTDELAKTTTFAQYQDPTAILENNKQLATMNDGYNPDRDIRRVASIPRVVLESWCQDAGISVTDYMRNSKHYAGWLRKKLYDSDNSMFLTAPHLRGGKKSSGIVGLDSVVEKGRKVG
jgi:hypothetical protein